MSKNEQKRKLLSRTVEHIDITQHDVVPLVDAMGDMAFSARDLASAARIYERMLRDSDCTVFLGLAGSLISAGLKQVIVDMIDHNMVDAIVATGANIVDQDFFEALGFRHYQGSKWANDKELRELYVDRIYDTFIDEEELQVCDRTIADLAGRLEPRPYSSREFIEQMGAWLKTAGKTTPSIVGHAYERGVPIFCPAFSDSSAGLGLIQHQWHAKGECLTIDSARDFLELTRIKLAAKDTGIVMIGGGVPKNFIQDTVIAAEVLGHEVPMHKYAIQITVADERDGALSGSTLREACSWGKVDISYEQMVYSEATLAMPLIVGYSYHKRAWEQRVERNWSSLLKREITDTVQRTL